MKIAYLCFLHPHKVPGGQQRITYELFNEARKRHGVESAVLIASDLERSPLRTADSSSLTEVAPREFVYVSPAFEHRFFTNYDYTGQLELMRLLESVQPDVVHFHHFLGFGLD